jgi:hypothetical protein
MALRYQLREHGTAQRVQQSRVQSGYCTGAYRDLAAIGSQEWDEENEVVV